MNTSTDFNVTADDDEFVVLYACFGDDGLGIN
jgi:hypothetical protein